MSLAPTQSTRSTHPYDWLLVDQNFARQARQLWFASIAFHHSHDQWNRLYARSQDYTLKVKILKAKRQRDQRLRLEAAEQDLRDWLAAVTPPLGKRRPSSDYVDKLVHYIKKRALSSPSDHAVAQSPAVLAPAS